MVSILLVEDREDVREAISDVLIQAGHSVQEAYDGNDAWPFIEHGDYDMMITDIMMPNKNGFDLINDLRSFNPELKIIAISGGGNYLNSKLTVTLASLNADASIPKPFTPEQILTAVENVMHPHTAGPSVG